VIGVLYLTNLKLLRDEKGVSQQKVADAVGSNQQSIHRYENGDYEPDIQTMVSLADYFDTSIDYLVGRTEIKRKIEPVEKYALNQEEASLIEVYRGFLPEYKQCLVTMTEALSKAIGSAK